MILLTAPAQAQQPDTTAGDTARTAPDTSVAGVTSTAEQRNALAREQAREAAASWLSLTDDGRFGESWDAAAPSLQEALSREEWIERGEQSRSALPSPVSRELQRAKYRDSTAQVPGEKPVVALQYRTDFDGETVLEAVVTAKQDTTWKVAGYRIVPAPDSVRAPDSTQTDADPDPTPQQ